MKYKIGDKVRIKSIDWYNKNKNKSGCVKGSIGFLPEMVEFCGKEAVITAIYKDFYHINIDKGDWMWNDEMFEGVAVSDGQTIPIPEGYEAKIEDGKVVFVKKAVKTWKDLERVKGYILYGNCTFIYVEKLNNVGVVDNRNVALTEKHCKAMLALAQISQLMPYYGGEITKEELEDKDKVKYEISYWADVRKFHVMYYETICSSILSFHTEEQAQSFIDNNEDLLRDFFMI